MILLLLSFVPFSDRINVIRDHVEVCEVNHFLTREGVPVCEIIWWNNSPGKLELVDSRCTPICGFPKYDEKRKLWVLQWKDDQGFGICNQREVTATFKFESFTRNPRAVGERKHLSLPVFAVQ